MKIKADTLLNDLSERTGKHLTEAEKLNQQTVEKLQYKPSEESWNALECVEHLNRYGDFYLPEIEQRIEQSNSAREEYFNAGLFGNYFAKSMLPKENMTQMNSPRDKNPLGSNIEKSVIARFADQQKHLLKLLEKSRDVSLSRTKVHMTMPLIKLKLGDVLRVVIYHNERHLVQAVKGINEAS